MTGCPHADVPAEHELCAHLVADEDASFFVVFSGRGTEHRLLCAACVEQDAPPLARVCAACFDDRIDQVFDALGVRGAPEVRVRASDLGFAHRELRLAGLDAPPAALAALGDDPRSIWLWLTHAGELLRVDLDGATAASIATGLPDLGPHPRLHVSPDGRFAAAVSASGQHGVVIELATGRTTMPLDRGTYQVAHSEFSIAFFRDGDRTLLVHATRWNRLDVSDPATGELLTARADPIWGNDDPRPAHYLDYFHAGLSISPDGRWLVDDGWIWHPFGSLRALDLRRWLHENPYESEDGPSVTRLRGCNYFWDGARCFADDRTLVAWGFGGDDEWMIDAAVIYDLPTGARVRWFAGPPRGRFVLDRHLVAIGAAGTSVWDLATGERLLDAPGFTPRAHHAAARRFLSVAPDGGLTESVLGPAGKVGVRIP